MVPASPLSWRNDIFQAELLCLSAVKSVGLCWGLNFSDAPQCLSRGSDWGVGAPCAGGSCEPVSIFGCAEKCLADRTDGSHGCLANWNVLSMGVYARQGQETRMTPKCFLLWALRRLSHPYHCWGNSWGAPWLPAHSHLSSLTWARPAHLHACASPSVDVSPPVFCLLDLCLTTLSVTFSLFSHSVLSLVFTFTLNCPVVLEVLHERATAVIGQNGDFRRKVADCCVSSPHRQTYN